MLAERCQAVCFLNEQRTAMAHLVPKPDLWCVDMLTKMHSMANLTPHRLHLPDLAEHCFCQYQLALDGVAGRPMLARHFFRVCPKNDVFWVRLPADALRILGGDENTRMFLYKPIYGQLDAPKRWFLEATRKLRNLGWLKHSSKQLFNFALGRRMRILSIAVPA